MIKLALRLAALLALVLPGNSLAHAAGEDYVFLTFEEASIEGHFEIHFDDLRAKLGLALESGEDEALAAL